MNGLRGAIGFLTTLGRPATIGSGTLVWFGPVGALVGAIVAGSWWTAAEVWGPGVAAAVAMAVDLAVTGCLHVDGLADAADGLLPPHADRIRRMEVMAAPDVGAFGMAATVAVLLTRWAAFAELSPSVPTLAAVVATWAAARTVMAWAAATRPIARPGGLASRFGGARSGSTVAVGIAIVAVAAGAAADPLPLAAVLGAAMGAAGVLVLAHLRIGGVSGDVLGAAGLIAECGGLLAIAAA